MASGAPFTKMDHLIYVLSGIQLLIYYLCMHMHHGPNVAKLGILRGEFIWEGCNGRGNITLKIYCREFESALVKLRTQPGLNVTFRPQDNQG